MIYSFQYKYRLIRNNNIIGLFLLASGRLVNDINAAVITNTILYKLVVD